MNNYFEASLYYELYKEIIFYSGKYNKQVLEPKDIDSFDNKSLLQLSDSNIVKLFKERSEDFLASRGAILNSHIKEALLVPFTIDSLKEVIKYLQPYSTIYLDWSKKYIDDIAYVVDVKMKEKGYEGSYPLYNHLEPSKLKLERFVCETNIKEVLDSKEKDFGLKITSIVYELKLKDYKYKDQSLKEMSRNEMYKYLDEHLFVSMTNSKTYLYTFYKLKEEVESERISKGELSLRLNDPKLIHGGLGQTLKQGLKSTLISMVTIIIITIIFLIYRRLNG